MDSLLTTTTTLLTTPYVFILAGVWGLIIGSFLNVVIARMPQMIQAQWLADNAMSATTDTSDTSITSHSTFNLISPASHCPYCKHRIGALENIPLLSYIFLRGRCKACQQPISLRYPLVEALSALLSVFTIYYFGISLMSGFALILVYTLIAASFIDIEHYIIPDDINLPILWLGLFINIFNVFTPLESAVLGAIAGYLSLWLVYWLFKIITKKEGMGYGDFIIFVLFGVCFGCKFLLFIILISCLLGSIIGIMAIVSKKYDRNTPMPFGPYLAIGGLTMLFWGSTLQNYYFHFLFFYK